MRQVITYLVLQHPAVSYDSLLYQIFTSNCMGSVWLHTVCIILLDKVPEPGEDKLITKELGQSQMLHRKLFL